MSTRIQLSGTFEVRIAGRDVTAELPGRQGRLLLAYLVANLGRAVPREELIDVVWDGALPGAPQAALSSLLTRLRGVLGAGAISGRAEIALVLDEESWVDVTAARAAAAAAEEALAHGDAERALARSADALALIENPALPELHREWVDRLRGELDRVRCEQLEISARAALCLRPADLVRAERFARRLMGAEPYREAGYALCMRALEAGGNVAEALRVYEALRVVLRDELGVTPAPSITAIHARMLCGGVPPPPASATPAAGPRVPLPAVVARTDSRPFVAREAELERLRTRWLEARARRAAIVLVTGEAGIGKTRVVARLAGEAHTAGSAVLYGSCDADSVVPYQPVTEAIRHYVAHAERADLESFLGPRVDELGVLLPELVHARRAPAGGGPEDRYRLFEAVLALLRHAAGAKPLLLVVEDLHDADAATLLMLRHIVRQAEGLAMMVLATHHEAPFATGAPLDRFVADLRRAHVVHRIALGGLDERGTAELVAAHAAGERTAVAPEALREYTAGNPFFIEETLRSTDGRRPGVPQSVQDVVSDRLARLAAPTLHVLTCASVLGREFALAALCNMAGVCTEDALTALETGARAGIIAELPERGDRYCFRHALMRDAVYERPPVGRRALLHVRAGESLLTARGRPDVSEAELAHHFYLGRHMGGAIRAVEHAVAAAREASSAHDHDSAARLYEHALEALDVAHGGEDERSRLLLALGAARWRAGQPGAREAFDEAARIARRRDDVAVLAEAALGAGGRFYAPAGVDLAYATLVEEALIALDPADAPERARLLARLAETLAPDAHDGRSQQLGRAAVAMSRRCADPRALAGALLARHATMLHVEHLDHRVAVAREAVALGDRLGDHELGALGRHWLIYDLAEAGDLDDARRRHAELEHLARDLRQPLFRHATLAWRGVWAQMTGRLDEAERLAREGLRLAERAGARDAHANFTGQLLRIRHQGGRLGELAPALEHLVASGCAVLPWAALLPLAQLEAGQRTRAGQAFADLDRPDRPAPSRHLWLTATAWTAESAVALRDVAAAERLYGELSPYAERFVQASFTGAWGSVHGILAALAGATGGTAAAARHLEAAIEREGRRGASPVAGLARASTARLALDAA